MDGVPTSTGPLRDGIIGPCVGGESDTLDEPAVDGRVSVPSTDEVGFRRTVGFLRPDAPSGQAHCVEVPTSHTDSVHLKRFKTYLSLAVTAAETGGLGLIALHVVASLGMGDAGQNIELTLTFLARQVRHPVLLRVNFLR